MSNDEEGRDWFERGIAADAESERGGGTDADVDVDANADSDTDVGAGTDSDGHTEANTNTTPNTDTTPDHQWPSIETAVDAETKTGTRSAAEPSTPPQQQPAASRAGGSLFDEDFSDAFNNAELPAVGSEGDDRSRNPPNMGPETGGGTPAFDADVEPDTELPRIELGIDGLDRMIQGGVPERSLMTAIGGAGTGKTTFGLQFLNHGLENGEHAVFVTLEETRERVINSATEKGYAFDEFDENGQLAIVDIDPIEMANSLASIRSELPVLIEEFGALRLVLDSVSLLEMMYEDRAKRRNEIFDFTRSLKQAGVTAMVTSEASQRTPYASRYGIVEYLTDAVFILQYIRPDDFRETRMAIEIQKIRDANHSREKKPYEITNEGISVYQQANLF